MANPDAERSGRRARTGARPVRKRAAVVPGALLETMLLDILGGDDVPLGAYALAAGLRARGRSVQIASISWSAAVTRSPTGSG